MSNIYLAGIDTLWIGFYLKQFKLVEEDWTYLEAAKEAAKAPVFKSSGYQFNFRGTDFVMKPAGKKPYSYVLVNVDLTLKIAKKVSAGKFPEIVIEMRSQFLWRFGYEYVIKFVKDWLETWTEIKSDVISRVDLTVDLQGFPEISIKKIVSRVRTGKQFCEYIPIKEGDIYYYGSKETGWSFGKSPLMMRIYNKTIEVKKSHKEWFYDLWAQNGWDGKSQVTRVEVELQRKFLKDFNVTTFASFKETIGDIFRFLTQDWFTLREPSEDKNRSRWPVAPFWLDVQGSLDQFGQVYGQIRGRIKEVKKDFLLPQAIGLLTSIAALSDDKNYSIHDFNFDMNRVLEKKGLGLKDIISEKRSRLTYFEDWGIMDLSGDDVEVLP